MFTPSLPSPVRFLAAMLLMGAGLFAHPVLAQGGPPFPGEGPDQERLKAIRTAFFTERLSLTPEEAATFWPVYNQYDEAREALLEGRGDQKPETLSDAELEAAVLAEFERQEKLLALNRQYLDRFKQALPARKAAMVFMLEHRFREEVVNAVRRRLSTGGPGGRSGSGLGGGPRGRFPAPDGQQRFRAPREGKF